MRHSYEEIRAAVLDVLAGREKNLPYQVDQFAHLGIAVAEVLARREGTTPQTSGSRAPLQLSSADGETFLEVFWDLFREGIVTLGLNNSNREFPFFRVSRLGQRLIENHDTYFFHDVGTYSALLQSTVPNIDPVTLLYVKEALQAFRSGCLLSSTVMLGVATEHTFNRVIEAANGSPQAKDFVPINKERSMLGRVDRFRRIMEQNKASLPFAISEDMDTHFSGIQSIIRTFRNQSGHPTGQIVEREQVYILLNLFVPYCRKMYQLIEHFS
jgi:hypothetical protein